MHLRPSLLLGSMFLSLLLPTVASAYLEPEDVLLEQSFQDLFNSNPPDKRSAEERAAQQREDYQLRHAGNPALGEQEDEEMLHGAAPESDPESLDEESGDTDTAADRRRERLLLRLDSRPVGESLHGAAPATQSTAQGETLHSGAPLSQTGPGLLAGLLLALLAVTMTVRRAAKHVSFTIER